MQGRAFLISSSAPLKSGRTALFASAGCREQPLCEKKAFLSKRASSRSDASQVSVRMSQKLPITVVIPVLNEARNLARCLSQLERFSEIVVIDSGSTDRTVEIAEQT